MRVICQEKSIKYSNGYFCREFCWDLESILARFQSKNGYILQRIDRTTTASRAFWEKHPQKDAFVHTYFEAWHIVQGKIEYPGTFDGFDDRWTYSSKIPSWEAAMNDYIEKYGTAGEVKMEGAVYWCHDNSAVAHEINKYFRVGAVKWAGKLLSAYECNEIESAVIFYNHHFCNEWRLRTENEIVKALIHRYRESALSKEEVLKDINKIFGDAPFRSRLYNAVSIETK